MADNEIKFVGNAEQLLKEYEKLEQKDKEREERLKKSTKQARESAREEKRLARDAEKIREKQLTDLQRHEKSLRHLDHLKKQNQLTEEEYQRAVAQEKEIYRRNTAELKKGETELARFNRRKREANQLLALGKITAQEHNRVLRESRRDYRNAALGADKWGGSLRNIAVMLGAGGLLMAGFARWKRANQEIIEQANEIGKAYDEAIRKFSVQTGLKGLALDEADESIVKLARKNAIGSKEARGIATQLVSSGFSAEEASGGSLDTFLQILQASNAAGQDVDVAQLAKSLTQFLSANNLDKSAENVAKFGIGTQRLFKGTNLQLAQMTDLAGASAAISNQITPEEQLASMAAIVDVIDSAEGSTGLRNFVSRLASSSANTGRTEALDQIGLSPEDVDFVGENLVEVIDRINQGLAQLPEEARKAASVKIFGERGEVGASAILGKREAIANNLLIQQDVAGFQDDVSIATSGRNAASVRQQIDKEQQLIGRDQLDDLYLEELKQQIRASNAPDFAVDRAAGYFSTNRYIGASTETALQRSLFMLNGLGRDVAPGVTAESVMAGVTEAQTGGADQVERLANALEENNQLLKENNDATKEETNQKRRGRPQGQSPQALNDRRMRGM